MKKELEKHFTASALIINNGRVLLVNHKKFGVWLYPGGHVEKNETPDQAVIREVKEETGLDVEILGEKDNTLADDRVSVLYNPYAVLCEPIGKNHYHNDLIYLCKVSGKKRKIKYDKDESDGIKFFSLEELDRIKLFPNFRSLLEKVLKN